MAGADYSGLAVNFEEETWTSMGYLQIGKKVVKFHKQLEEDFKGKILKKPEDEVIYHPRGESYNTLPGIAKYKDWFIVYGYAADVDIREFLKEFLRKNGYERYFLILNRILKKDPIIWK